MGRRQGSIDRSLHEHEERAKPERLCDLRVAQVRLLRLFTRKALTYPTPRSSRLRPDWCPSPSAPNRLVQLQLL